MRLGDLHALESVTLEHVRLRGAQIAAPLARQRLSYLLSSVALRPSHMSPSAVLVVRSISDPLPGAIAKQLDSAAYPSSAWESAARARLSALYGAAARPARSLVRPTAEAVLFADYSELLACLALDLATGAGPAWWWKSILRRQLARFSGASADIWPQVWAEHPLYVPAALQLLHERGQAVRVLERIDAAQAWKLLLVVGRAFGIRALEEVGQPAAMVDFTRRSRDGPSYAATQPQSDSERIVAPGLGRSVEASQWLIVPPWEPSVATDAAAVSLGAERRALLGVSLLLHQAPQRIQKPHFAPQFRSWLAAELRREAGITEPDVASSPRSPLPGLRVGTITVTEPDARTARSNNPPMGTPPSGPNDEATTDELGEARVPMESQTGAQTVAQTVSSLRAADRAADSAASDVAAEYPGKADSIETAPAALNRPNITELQVAYEDGCCTTVGGVFFLIHLLLRSELLSFDVGLRGWALLELLARCLLHREWQAVADDPIWDALAILDFREPGTHPGAEFTPQETYQAPESWLRGLDDSKRCFRFRSARLQVWLEEGFPILDSAARAATASCARMTHWQRRAFSKGASVCAPGLELAAELRRFLHFLLPFVRWRLRRALGGASLTDILRRRGMLYITGSHVDLVMHMEQISMPARFAGLDFNPGWTPELGRVIQFHFVDGFGERAFSRGGR